MSYTRRTLLYGGSYVVQSFDRYVVVVVRKLTGLRARVCVCVCV